MSVEIPLQFVNAKSVEDAYRLCKIMQEQSNKGSHQDRIAAETFAHRGFKAALKKDQRTMKVLEKATEVLHQIMNTQLGQYQYREDIKYSEKVAPTVVQLWREAYVQADKGMAMEQFKWIYGAACHLAYG